MKLKGYVRFDSDLKKSLLESKLVLQDGESYILASFTNKRLKIKLGAVQQSSNESANDDESTRKAITEDRKLLLQATIVRIMKSKKTCSHALLIDAIIDLVKSKFVPEISLIKRTIEVLIDKQFIERKGTDYFYLS